MRHHRRVVVVAVAVVIGLLALLEHMAETQQLMDAATGAGVAGDVVLSVHSRFHQVSKSVRARSRFEFVDLPPGAAVVQVLADGFAPHFDTLTIDGKERTNIRIRLMQQAIASGHVLEADVLRMGS